MINRIVSGFLDGFIYKEGTKEVLWGKAIFNCALVLFLIGFAIHGNRKWAKLDSERNSEPRYSIGIITEKYKNIRSTNPKAYYKYYVNGRYYSGSNYYNTDHYKVEIGDRFYVKFYRKDPNNVEILFDKPVLSDDIILIKPDSGWVNIPEYK